MNPPQLLRNLTVVSVFQAIFVQQNYRTVNFYSNSSQNEIFHEVIRIASDSFTPFKHMNFDELSMKRRSYAEPILNIVILGDLSDVYKRLRENCLYETTVIWLTSQNDEFNDTLTHSFKVSSKVVVLTNSYLYTLNNFVDTTFNRLSLKKFSLSLTNQFLTNFFSIESIKGSNLTIFTELNAPNSDLTQIDDDYYIIGPDGIMAESLVEQLNLKPTFSSSVGIRYPNYTNWLNGPILSRRLRFQNYHSAVLTKNVVKIFDHNISSKFDIQITSFPHQGRNFPKRLNISTEALFAHDIDCLTAIVPQQEISNHFLKVVHHGDTIAIFIALFLFIITRIFLQKGTWHRGFSIAFDAFGVFLNQTRISNDNQVKVAWDINLRAFSLLATTALSAIIFKNLIAAHSDEINTIDQLVKSNLTIFAPQYLKQQEIWGYMRPSLRSKFVLTTGDEIQKRLIEERKFDSAYIYSKSKTNYIVQICNSIVEARSRVRVMKEHIHCSLASYRISENSPLAPYVNVFILRFMENGIFNKQLEWMQDLNEAVFQAKYNEPPKSVNIVLTLQMTIGVFIVYSVGMGIAILSFVIEMVFGYLFPLV